MKTITKWEAPKDGGASLLTMPNVPLPLHMRAPREIMGRAEWNKLRRATYEDAGDVCEICGQKLCGSSKGDYPLHHAHELYSYDYETYTATFERCICVDPQCHSFIHSGRALTCYQNHTPLYDKEYMLNLAEHGFSLIHRWNTQHPNAEPLRVYATFLDWLAESSLHDEMEELFKRYEIEVYAAANRSDWENAWGKWKLVFEGEEYPGLFSSRKDWEKEMESKNRIGDKVDLFSEESINIIAGVEDGLWQD